MQCPLSQVSRLDCVSLSNTRLSWRRGRSSVMLSESSVTACGSFIYLSDNNITPQLWFLLCAEPKHRLFCLFAHSELNITHTLTPAVWRSGVHTLMMSVVLMGVFLQTHPATNSWPDSSDTVFCFLHLIFQLLHNWLFSCQCFHVEQLATILTID